VIPQVRKLATIDQLRGHLDALGIDLPIDEVVDPSGALAQTLTVCDGSAGDRVVSNRFAILPMEGWDATGDGRPTDLVQRRWERFGASGAGIVWAEATAVRRDGRANPRQLVLDANSIGAFASLRRLLAPEQLVGLQLTHSGRYSRPLGAPLPRIVYRHPLLDGPVDADDAALLSDDELDELVDEFVGCARLAHEAGFDFVDVKACHGYLGHELLSAIDRPGRYGGAFEGRTRFLRTVIEGIRAAVPGLAIALRLSAFDVVPHVAGPDGVGVPAVDGPYRHAFGGDGTGSGIDLSEAHQVLDLVAGLGVGLVCVTAGSPYYCPHVQRPAFFPPSDGYRSPEDPLVATARMIDATAELATGHPEIAIVGSGYSYLQEWLANVAQAVVRNGGAASVGLGRMALSYPDLPSDVLAGAPVDRHRLCRTFSDCTTAPRAGLVSGCYPLDPFYKARPERIELAAKKRSLRASP